MDDDFGAAAVSTPALPPNWRSAKAADGKEYYFNELTGETSWTFPSGNGAAALAFCAWCVFHQGDGPR